MQGDGCTARNLTSLVRHILALPNIDCVVDFLLQAMKKRRGSRRNPFAFQWIVIRLEGVQLGSPDPVPLHRG